MTVVLATGTFDPFHIGHLWHLEAAAAMGDTLTVAVTSDEAVREQKGADRPVFKEGERAEILRALRIVNHVIVVDSALEALYAVAPNIFALGQEYRGRVEGQHQAYCDLHNVKIEFTYRPVYSSTKLLAHYAGSR